MKINRSLFGAAAMIAMAFAHVSFAQTQPATPPAEKPKEQAPAAPAKPDAPKPQDKTPGANPETPKTPATPSEATMEEKLVYVKMTTTKGDMILELDKEKAPISVANFLSYVDKKFYDGTIFHRVIPTFMIQGGGFTPDMKQKPTEKPIQNEWKNGKKNLRGTLAMARTRVPDSATSQFFINVVDNAFLDDARDGAAYAVFGKVVSGMDTVDKIKTVKTGVSGQHENVPTEAVIINSVTRMTPEEARKAIGEGAKQ